MPAKSKSQQRLMGAVEHGATFPKAEQLRDTLTHAQLHDFASGTEAGKPERVKPVKAAPMGHPNRLAGSHDGLYVTEHHRGARKP